MDEAQPTVPPGFCHCGCGEKTNLRPANDPRGGGLKGEPYRFLWGHHVKLRYPDPEYVVDDAGCWVWQRYIDRHGYGRTHGEPGKVVLAHRAYYERLVGPIPEGLQLDHLCRNRACVNPKHLEPVTNRVNVLRGNARPAENARKTHCIHGHPFVEGNTYFSQGKRQCRACALRRNRIRRERERGNN